MLNHRVLFGFLAVFDPSVGHTINVLHGNGNDLLGVGRNRNVHCPLFPKIPVCVRVLYVMFHFVLYLNYLYSVCTVG